MRHVKVLLGIALLFAASAALGYFTQLGTPDAVLQGAGVHSPAIWNSDALTPAELVDEADIVVRAQVLEQTDTFLYTPQPYQSPEAAARLTSQGYQVPQLPFTASLIEVLEVYSGDVSVGDRIKVGQTAGFIDGQKAELLDDPLYEIGTEHVLFLRDVSSEKNNSGFATVNPAGRYRVLGDQLEIQTSFFEVDPTAAPLDLPSLEAAIRAAVDAPSGPSLSRH
ncbi:MAG: hypothetical protein SX243_04285 [Acidobacteriota bacterium]|nr:hypothetical protein [Acidobacteriota bacterium]